jgi:hypothetical protein
LAIRFCPTAHSPSFLVSRRIRRRPGGTAKRPLINRFGVPEAVRYKIPPDRSAGPWATELVSFRSLQSSENFVEQ